MIAKERHSQPLCVTPDLNRESMQLLLGPRFRGNDSGGLQGLPLEKTFFISNPPWRERNPDSHTSFPTGSSRRPPTPPAGGP